MLCCAFCLLAVTISSFAAWTDENGVYHTDTLFTSSCTKEEQDFLREWTTSKSSFLISDANFWKFYIVDTNPQYLYFNYSYPGLKGQGRYFYQPTDGITTSTRSFYFRRTSGELVLHGIIPEDYTSYRPNGRYDKHTQYSSIWCGSIFDNYLDIKSFPLTGLSVKDISIHDDLGIFSPLPVVAHNLTINYQYEDGSIAAPSYTHAFSVDDSYSVASPLIAGYVPDVDTVSGTMADSDITVTVTYRKEIPDPVLYDITIDYLYGDGSPASVTYNARFPVGETYNVPSPLISGYTPDRSVVSGVMPENNVEEEVFYFENKPPPIDPPDPPVDPPLPDVDPEFVAFHLPAIYEMVNTIRFNVGNIFTVCLWCFLIFLTFFLISHIVGYLGQ